MLAVILDCAAHCMANEHQPYDELPTEDTFGVASVLTVSLHIDVLVTCVSFKEHNVPWVDRPVC